MDYLFAIIIIMIIIMIYLILTSALAKDKTSVKTPVKTEIGGNPNLKILSKPDLTKDKPADWSEYDWNKLSEGEQIQFLMKFYGNLILPDEVEDKSGVPDRGKLSGSAAISAASNLVATLAKQPDNDTCSDTFSECAKWAANDECVINPEYMLYNCAKSCKACSYTPADKAKLVKLYNNAPPIHCVYHGDDYPGEFQYMNRLYDYTVAINF